MSLIFIKQQLISVILRCHEKFNIVLDDRALLFIRIVDK